jgi:hypothetical protein
MLAKIIFALAMLALGWASAALSDPQLRGGYELTYDEFRRME